MDYVDERLTEISQYMSVYDNIALGDTLALNLQYDKAEGQYLSAKSLATKIYFDQGREDAIAALEQLYAEQKTEKEAAAQETQQATENQSEAASIMSEGDAAFSKGDYERATVFYTTALQKFSALEDEMQIKALTLKLAMTDQKRAQQLVMDTEATGYMSQAERLYSEQNYIQAKKYYLLAKDVYASMQNNDKVSEVIRRLELIEMGITEAELAAEEVKKAEEDKQAEEEGKKKASDLPQFAVTAIPESSVEVIE